MKKRIAPFNLLILCLVSILVILPGCITIKTAEPGPTEPTTPSTDTLPMIKSFTANPDTIKAGQQAQLSWTVSNATKITISPAVGGVNDSGMTAVNPTATTTYTLIAENQAGTKNARVTVNVTAGIGKPDLVVTDIFLQAETVYFVAKNMGNAPSTGCRAQLFVNEVSEVDGNTYVDPLPPGEERKLKFGRFTWPYSIEKQELYDPTQKHLQYKVKVCVDYVNTVSEIDEANNCYSITLGSKLKYNFVEGAHQAYWNNGSSKIKFPSPAGNIKGSVFTQAGMTLEDGRSHASILATYPEPIAGGVISGDYAFDTWTGYIVVPSNARFTAAVGFKQDAPVTARARFIFYVQDWSLTRMVYSQEIIASYDNKLDYFDIDLSAFEGKKHFFSLEVESLSAPGEDLAVWVDPVISQ